VGALVRHSRGFIIPLIILGILSMAFFGMILYSLSGNYSSQVQHIDEVNRVRAIGEAVSSMIIAKLREKPFEERFFKNKPYQESDQKLLNGIYDLYIEDDPTNQGCFDLYVRASFGRARKTYFWRIKHEESILDSLGKAYSIIFLQLEPQNFPTPRTNPFLSQIRDMLKQRRANESDASKSSATISSLDKLADVISVLNANPPGHIAQPFDPPRPPAVTPPIDVNPVPPPSPISSGSDPVPSEQAIAICEKFAEAMKNTLFKVYLNATKSQQASPDVILQAIADGAIAKGGPLVDPYIETMIDDLVKQAGSLSKVLEVLTSFRTATQSLLEDEIRDLLVSGGMGGLSNHPGVVVAATDTINRTVKLIRLRMSN